MRWPQQMRVLQELPGGERRVTPKFRVNNFNLKAPTPKFAIKRLPNQ
jgi:hypothetical protein